MNYKVRCNIIRNYVLVQNLKESRNGVARVETANKP